MASFALLAFILTLALLPRLRGALPLTPPRFPTISSDWRSRFASLRARGAASGMQLTLLLGTAALTAQAQTASFSGAIQTLATGISNPYGLAVDASGNVFLPDTRNNVVKEIVAAGGYTTMINIGTGFSGPTGIAIDNSGNLYIADSGNHAVKEVLASGGYTTIKSLATGFTLPAGVALNASGDIFVADYSASTVKEITAASSYKTVNTVGSGFKNPAGIALDTSGNLFVADSGNNVVKEVMAAGGYTTVKTVGSGFSLPLGIVLDSSNNFYVADCANHLVKEVFASGGYTTFKTVGVGFSAPGGMALDLSGNVYVTDVSSAVLKQVMPPGGNFGPIAVGSKSAGSVSLAFTFTAAGTLGSAPAVLTQGTPGLDFADAKSGTCTTNGTTHTYAVGESCTVDVSFTPGAPGDRFGAATLRTSAGALVATGYVQGNGVAPKVSFSPGTVSTVLKGLINPRGIASDGAGNLYILNTDNMQAVKLSASGAAAATLINQSTLDWPLGIAVDGAGNVYIDDTYHSRILKEVPLNGSYQESVVISQGLDYPEGLAVDGAGRVYIADTGSGHVLLETPTGTGSYTLTQLPFSGLVQHHGIAVDGQGNLYIADTGNNRILKETLLAGVYTQSVVPTSALNFPREVVVDASGSLYLADAQHNRLLKESLVNGAYSESVLYKTGGELDSVAIDQNGNVYFTDTTAGNILKLDMADSPSLQFPSTTVGQSSADQAVSLQNIGNSTLQFPEPSSGSNPAISANFSIDSSPGNECVSNKLSLDQGDSCSLTMYFAPTATGALQGNLVVSDTSLNAVASLQALTLTGTATAVPVTLALSAPTTATYGNPVQVVASLQAGSSQGSLSGGSVAFADQTSPFGTQTVSNGTATQSYLAPAVGSFTLFGNYTPASSNDTKASAQTTIKITAAPLNVAAINATRTYGAANPQFAGSITGAVAGDSFTEAFQTPATAASAVASYKIVPSASGANLANYAQNIQNGVLQVTPAGLTVTANNATRTYGATNPQFSGSITGAVNGDVLTESFTTPATAASPVSTYPIVPNASGASAANYTQTVVNGALTVSPASLAVSANDATRTYGSPNPVFTGAVSGAVNGDAFTTSFTTTATASSPVATYPIVPSASGPGAANYTQTVTNGTLTVSPAALALKASDATRTYGAANPTFTGSITGAVNGDSFTPSFTTAATAGSPVATYAIVPSAAGANLANYSQSITNGTLTVSPAALALEADDVSRVYGTPNPVLTGTIKGLVGGDVLTESYSTPATQASPVGTYSITPSVSGAAIANYTSTVQPGRLTITAAALQITADSVSRAYGTPNPGFTGKIIGAVAGDALSEQFATTATTATAPGTYSIVPTLVGDAGANYQVAISNGVLTITAPPLTVTAADATRVYGSANPAFSGTVVGAANGDSFTETFTTSATAQSGVGSYPILPAAHGNTLQDYQVTPVSGQLVITPAPLQVQVAPAARTYGAANPQLTGSVSGLVNNEAVQVIYSTPASASEPVGQYPIIATAQGSALNNYTVSIVPSTITIAKAATATTMHEAPNTAAQDGSILLTAQVASSTTGTPTGLVRFYDGKTLLGETAITSGVAQLTALPAYWNAANPLVAVYQGDSNFLPSSSDELPLALSTAGFWLKPMPNTAAPQVASGGSVNLSFMAGPGTAGIYPGVVTFSVSGLPQGATGVFSPATLPADGGEHAVSLVVQMPGHTLTVSSLQKPLPTQPGSIRMAGAAMALMLLPLVGATRLRKAGRGLVLTALLLAGAFSATSFLTGCGFSAETRTVDTPQTYPLVITMESAGTTQTATATLTVTKQ
ncbi:MBG domain-containing protein [Acidipila sp. EB88]|uniref:MBG domain-containing protein n=1 Tax=Acidipila sp. EB88 TaxID=2305226 RepID=UPI000F5F459F|nr:MBG domain-containing protein [Acidipila sp. EB88]RRA48391.1 choice-of-anchor D domain-containing protein [Acidipila sp. EB88]